MTTPLLESVLIANRGEIALRVVRACRELGIRSIAVYSDVDRLAPHVLHADQAVRIGPAPAGESYLSIPRILEAAERTGAAAVHPGYGFLAERAEFAAAVVDAGLVFVGPTPDTIRAMGDKTEARRRMRKAGVPIVPGLVDPARDDDAALSAAEEIGYPVLLKAAAGGGGKGMRAVHTPDELPRAFEAARREAEGAFGDGAIYLERYLDRPRHIEIQVLGDEHGNVVHLGERECSIQRRHQKLIEEAPSTVLDPSVRAAMGDAAVRAAKAVDYRGAGTIEFLWEEGEYHFLEMNTRIQVEHPVTELVTGIDLVEWQLRIASGQALTFGQADVELTGHAIECRVTAEEVSAGFLPATGVVASLELPSGPGVRWDGGVREGQEIGLNYDSLLGKLIVHGADRPAALARLARALGEISIVGVETSLPFHARILAEPSFIRGDLDIHYLDRHPELLSHDVPEREQRAIAILVAALEADRREAARTPPSTRDGDAPAGAISDWQRAGWSWLP